MIDSINYTLYIEKTIAMLKETAQQKLCHWNTKTTKLPRDITTKLPRDVICLVVLVTTQSEFEVHFVKRKYPKLILLKMWPALFVKIGPRSIYSLPCLKNTYLNKAWRSDEKLSSNCCQLITGSVVTICQSMSTNKLCYRDQLANLQLCIQCYHCCWAVEEVAIDWQNVHLLQAPWLWILISELPASGL